MLPASAYCHQKIVLLDRDNRGIEAPSACHATPSRHVINRGCERPNNFHEPHWRHDEMTSCQRGALGKYDTRIRQALEIHIPHLLAKIILMISEGMTNSDGLLRPYTKFHWISNPDGTPCAEEVSTRHTASHPTRIKLLMSASTFAIIRNEDDAWHHRMRLGFPPRHGNDDSGAFAAR